MVSLFRGSSRFDFITPSQVSALHVSVMKRKLMMMMFGDGDAREVLSYCVCTIDPPRPAQVPLLRDSGGTGTHTPETSPAPYHAGINPCCALAHPRLCHAMPPVRKSEGTPAESAAWRPALERFVIYCQTTSASAAHATRCATYCTRVGRSYEHFRISRMDSNSTARRCRTCCRSFRTSPGSGTLLPPSSSGDVGRG